MALEQLTENYNVKYDKNAAKNAVAILKKAYSNLIDNLGGNDSNKGGRILETKINKLFEGYNSNQLDNNNQSGISDLYNGNRDYLKPEEFGFLVSNPTKMGFLDDAIYTALYSPSTRRLMKESKGIEGGDISKLKKTGIIFKRASSNAVKAAIPFNAWGLSGNPDRYDSVIKALHQFYTTGNSSSNSSSNSSDNPNGNSNTNTSSNTFDVYENTYIKRDVDTLAKIIYSSSNSVRAKSAMKGIALKLKESEMLTFNQDISRPSQIKENSERQLGPLRGYSLKENTLKSLTKTVVVNLPDELKAPFLDAAALIFGYEMAGLATSALTPLAYRQAVGVTFAGAGTIVGETIGHDAANYGKSAGIGYLSPKLGAMMLAANVFKTASNIASKKANGENTASTLRDLAELANAGATGFVMASAGTRVYDDAWNYMFHHNNDATTNSEHKDNNSNHKRTGEK